MKKPLTPEQRARKTVTHRAWCAANKEHLHQYYLATKARRGELRRAWRAENKDSIDQKSAEWLRANPDKSRLYQRRAQLKKYYGITFEDFEALWEAQGRRCALCSKALPLIDKHTHVDHSHATGKVRGILCKRCNIRLGYLEERGEPGILNDLLYIKRFAA